MIVTFGAGLIPTFLDLCQGFLDSDIAFIPFIFCIRILKLFFTFHVAVSTVIIPFSYFAAHHTVILLIHFILVMQSAKCASREGFCVSSSMRALSSPPSEWRINNSAFSSHV